MADRSRAEPVGDGLAVGITGHRSDRLAPAAVAAVRAAMRELLALIRGLDGGAAAGGRGMRLWSMLASGADTAAAEAALELGIPLVAVLPFARERYDEDFDAAGRRVFRSLLARAERVCEPAGDAPAEHPYERGGRVLVEAVDLLAAVWDGGPGRGPGGTAAVVELALARGRPVVVLPPDRPAAFAILRPGGTAGAEPAGRPAIAELVRSLGKGGNV